MKTKLLFTLMLFAVAYDAFAYPITPRPLRKLIIESSYIVYAYVDTILPVDNKDSWYQSKAILTVKEVLQGVLRTTTLEVYFSPGMVCPAPARYQAGSNVLAFLNGRKANGGYTTPALSYGAKTLTPEAFVLYRQRIREMQHIFQLADYEDRRRQTIDWLIACAAHPATAWEGLYELSPESDFMSFYDGDLDTFVKKYTLTAQQKAQLRLILFARTTLSYSDMGLIDLVIDAKDAELLTFLSDQFDPGRASDLWWAVFLLERIVWLSNRDDLQALFHQIEQLDREGQHSEEQLRQLAGKFKDLLLRHP